MRFSLNHAAAAFGREWSRARHQVAVAYLLPAIPPLIAVSLFSDMMSAAESLPGFPAADYRDYMVPGAMLLAGMMFAGYTAVGVAEDLRSGFSDRLRLLGVATASVTAGRLAFEGVRILPTAVVTYSVVVLTSNGLAFHPAGAAAVVALACAWAAAYNAVFHVVALRTGNPHAPVAMQPLFAVLTFPSTFWYPGVLMPTWGRQLTDWNPMSWLTDAARAMAEASNQPATIGLGLAVVAGTALVAGSAMGRISPRGRP